MIRRTRSDHGSLAEHERQLRAVVDRLGLVPRISEDDVYDGGAETLLRTILASGRPEETRLPTAARAADGSDARHVATRPATTLRPAGARSATARARAARGPAARRTVRLRVGVLSGAIASLALIVGIGIVNPLGPSAYAGSTPPLLNFEYVSPEELSGSPGIEGGVTLQALADAAFTAGTPAPPAPGESVQYLVSDSWALVVDADSGGASISPTQSETWLAADGSARILERRSGTLDSTGRLLPENRLGPAAPIDSDERHPTGSLDAGQAARLSTDPAALESQLLAEQNCQDDATVERATCLIEAFRELNRFSIVSPEVTQAFWQLLSGYEGVRSLGAVVDRAGRPGIGLSLVTADGSELDILIASLTTGELLGSETLLLTTREGLDVEPPAVIGFTTYLSREWRPGP